MYGFLEPQSIHHAKDRRQECQQYIETWVKGITSTSVLRTLLESVSEIHVIIAKKSLHYKYLIIVFRLQGTLASYCSVSIGQYCCLVLFFA